MQQRRPGASRLASLWWLSAVAKSSTIKSAIEPASCSAGYLPRNGIVNVHETLQPLISYARINTNLLRPIPVLKA